ncbi:MAG: sialate O-acetylesterase [Ignavibacteria bacterium]|nr:sialate O-acetylesterase [Ignavibacteria bacterium]
MKKVIVLSLICFSFLFAQTEMTKLKLPAIFSDNMVLQQKTDAAFWGNAEPDQKINISGSWGKNVSTKSKNDGTWLVKIKTPKAGGPFEVKITSGSDTVSYKNILIGEVWLCSGQSNMEMPLAGWPPRDTIYGASKEIPAANYPNLRLFTVTRSISTVPEKDCTGKWSECTPENASSFSATAFFFGKKLMNELNIPIGLIHSSWGGTPVEAWTDAKNLSTIPQYKELIDKYANSKEEYEKLTSWLVGLPQIDLSQNTDENKWSDIDLKDKECSSVNYDDSKWYETNMPSNFDRIGLANFDGVIWYRKQIEIPETWLNKELVLELGPIDDMDATYVNGVKVGGFEKDGFWQVERVHVVPAELVKDKKLTIAIRVLDNQGGGGFNGATEKFRLHLKATAENISIAGTWRYLPVAEYRNAKFYVFDAGNLEFMNRPKLSIEISAYMPTTLYNAMISPLIPYNLRGAIWYQGESNTGEPELYKTVFPMMIKNWRHDFNNQFSFYFAQISPYRYDEGTNSQLLREAQFQSLSVPKTGMAVTLDIGNVDNIHPGNKKDVGERLALWALAKDFGKKLIYSGPGYKSAKIQNDKMVLTFEHAKGLELKPRDGKTKFQIAGEDKVFKDAFVTITGNKIIVSSPEVKEPKAVRYCWSDIAEGTLFNEAGLPASSFRTDNWND